MNRRSSLLLALVLTLAACGTDATSTEAGDDLTNNAPDSLADASGEIDQPTFDVTSAPESSTSTLDAPVTVTTLPGFDELTAANFLDDTTNSREANADEAELVELMLADLNSLDYRWDSDVIDIEAPAEQTGDVTSVLTYTATAWTTLEDPDEADGRIGARVVYEMTVTARVTTAAGVVLDQAIVNDCLNLDFCPEGVSRDTVTVDRIVSFDRVDLIAEVER